MTADPYRVRVLEAPGVVREVRPGEEAAVRAQLRLVAEAADGDPGEAGEPRAEVRR